MKIALLGLCTIVLCIATPRLHAETVLVLGDSISAAYGIQREQGWVALLQNRLSTLSDTHKVVNASISGETTGGGLARLASMLKIHHPDIVILELGGNDGLRGYPIESIVQNMQQLVTMSQQAGARVVILGMRIPPNYGVRYTEAFYEIYQSLGKSSKAILIPFFMAGIGDQPTYMQNDGVHPTSEAQQILLENVWQLLSSLF